jgi:hypothetical protein
VELNNRELALVVWAGITLLFVLSKGEVRSSVFLLVRDLVKPPISVMIFSFAGYLAACVWLAAQFELWNWELINETVFWFLVTGPALFLGSTKAYEEDGFFLRTAKRMLTLGLLAEFFISLVALPFWAEFLLIPIATFLVMLSVVAGQKSEQAPVKSLVDGLTSVIGLGLFAFVLISLLTNPGQLDPVTGLQTLALPVWLLAVSLPFIYLLGLYAAYDKAFRRINWMARKDRRLARKACLAMLRRFHFRARRVGRFHGRWQKQLLMALLEGQSNALFQEFMREQRQSAS